MSSDLTEVIGAEAPAGGDSPFDALIEFYRAFNAGDLNGLAANWAEGDAPSMDNPIDAPEYMICCQQQNDIKRTNAMIRPDLSS